MAVSTDERPDVLFDASDENTSTLARASAHKARGWAVR
jgi:hypothetical protein